MSSTPSPAQTSKTSSGAGIEGMIINGCHNACPLSRQDSQGLGTDPPLALPGGRAMPPATHGRSASYNTTEKPNNKQYKQHNKQHINIHKQHQHKSTRALGSVRRATPTRKLGLLQTPSQRAVRLPAAATEERGRCREVISLARV